MTRVEEASPTAWTNVLVSPKGKTVRADYSLVEEEEPARVLWRHEVQESPFERLLADSTVELALEADTGGGTRVRVTLDQRPRGWARFSPFQLRAAAAKQAESALDGLAGAPGGRALMRWWGWGEDGHAVPLPPAADALLRDELGADPELRRRAGAARAGVAARRAPARPGA